MDNFGIFLDRDGVVIENRPDYVKSFNEVVFIPEAILALRLLSTLGFPIFFVSNQSCVNRGIISWETMWAIQDEIVLHLGDYGIQIAFSAFCPHTPEQHCRCRKPKTELIDWLRSEYNIRGGGWMIGDGWEDMLTAQNARLQPMLVLTGRGVETSLNNPSLKVPRYANILEAAKDIKAWSDAALISDPFAKSVA